MKLPALIVLVILAHASSAHAFMGAEVVQLLQLVSGQVKEIESLAEIASTQKTQIEYLNFLNQGIDQTLNQIQAIQSLTSYSQGLDPTETRSLSDLNGLLRRTHSAKAQVEEVMALKLQVADQAIEKSALQSESTYKMGQEFVSTGSSLAEEAKTASPGRASQISAAASSAQMLSDGVALQTLSQLVQLQAMSLEFQKSKAESDLRAAQVQRDDLKNSLRDSLRHSARMKGGRI